MQNMIQTLYLIAFLALLVTIYMAEAAAIENSNGNGFLDTLGNQRSNDCVRLLHNGPEPDIQLPPFPSVSSENV